MKEKIKAILQSFVKPFDIGIGLPYWHVIEADKINEISEEISKALPQLYSIKPLEWEQPTPNHWHAQTDLAEFDYHIICLSLTKVELRRVGGNGTESEMFCKNILEAKAKAQEDWQERLSQYLTEYKEG